MRIKSFTQIIVLTCLILFVLTWGTLQKKLEPQVDVTISYFSQETVLDYGQSFISSIVSHDKSTSWKANTHPSEVVPTYDLDNNVNAYIINLETDNNPTGYLFIEAFPSDTPNIMEFGYSGVYYITNETHFAGLKSKKLIYLGNRGFITNTNGEYRDATNDKKIDMNKQTMKNYYLKFINKA